MITAVIIDGQRYGLNKEDVIGEGGEAVIFGLKQIAFKVYRSPTKKREQKLLDFLKGNFKLPDNVFNPLRPAYDLKGNLVGFTMKQAKAGCDPIAVFKNKIYCAQNGITAKTVVNIFQEMHKSLTEIHQTGIVVGDLNDRNEIFNPIEQKVFWIDVDSWQIGRYPCMVGTEDYLSPDLYGIDLTQKPYFKEEHDWFSFVVLLFRSLLRIHPFKAGIHPRYNSLMVRAQKGITVLDSDIRYPTIGLSPDILSDDLASLLIDFLKRKRRDPFPFDALERYGEIIVKCPSCREWYAGTRNNCPGCQTKNIVDMRLRQALAGCECEIFIATFGKIIFFQIVGEIVYCLADENGTTFLYKKSPNQKVIKKKMFKTRHGAKFGFFEENLVVCADPANEDPELFILDISGPSPKPLLKTTTKTIAGGKAVFNCSAKYLYHIVGSKIMRANVFKGSNQLLEREVMQSLNGQTWFTVSSNNSFGPEFLMGFYRIFDDFRWFLVRSDSETSFKRFEVNLPQLIAEESMIDLSIKFSASSALVIRKIRKRGIDHVRIDLVNGEDGKIICSTVGKIKEMKRYENIHGKAFNAGIIMHPIDEGIISEKIIDQQIKVITGSDQFVGSDEALYVYDNELLIVTDDRILLVKPKQGR